MSNRLIPQGGGKTPDQFCADNGFSKTTWRHMRLRGDAPRLTWVTSTRCIIHPEHEQEWLDARTDPPRDDAA